MPGSNHYVIRDIEIRKDLMKTSVIHQDIILWEILILIASP
ncbi:MAG: hypothetical protein OQK71_02020 [Desulfobacter sp.]|nr:hypothetical protein [uncultured Desulfobacter sp.]MCW8799681.1 hypothetical protein [Desulfobacter sp.]